MNLTKKIMDTKIFPQAVTAHPVRNVIFIVYKINDGDAAEDAIKDLR